MEGEQSRRDGERGKQDRRRDDVRGRVCGVEEVCGVCGVCAGGGG